MAEIERRLVRAATFMGETCDTCNRLELSVDKFLIGDSDISRSINRSSLAGDRLANFSNATPRLQLNSGRGPKSLGTIAEIQDRATGCSLCKLVYEAIGRYSATSNVDQDSDCLMEWEVDGRQARRGHTAGTGEEEIRYSNVSRRIRFWWTQVDRMQQEAYILFVPPRDHPLPNADANSVRPGMRGRWYLARDYDTEKSNQALIKSWLDLCEGHHGKACKHHGDTDRFAALLQQTSFGVIDVVRMQLRQLPTYDNKPARYVALSYVWGEGDNRSHCTLRENVMQRIQPGGIEARELPRTIQEAIQLTRDLGKRFIWIDSLCIVQDSDSSWRLNAANMDLVYGNAYLTICAADGDNSRVGLAALDPQEADTPLKAVYAKGLRLLVSRPSESVIRDSAWNQRAWTFQERILSRRCLLFAGKRIYFQCRSSNMSQDIYPDGTGTGWSSDWKNSPLRTLGELETRPIWFYMTCVSLYTGRRLTYAKDILAAFDGVARLMERHMHGARMIHGLPPSHFDLALLWEPLQCQERRVLKTKDGQSGAAMEFPSWSWSGWMDGRGQKKGARVKYRQETLEGCFIDVNEWLLHHTWIKWYIRNANGDLRPIWTKKSIPAAPGVSSRWHGYSAMEPGQRPTPNTYDPEQFHPHSRTDTMLPPFEHGGNQAAGDGRDAAGTYTREAERYQQAPATVNRRIMAVPSDRGGNEDDDSYDARIWVYERGERRAVDRRERERHLDTPSSSYTMTATTTTDSTITRWQDTDEYGRKTRSSVKDLKSDQFHATIPDNPFGVNNVDFESLRQWADQTVLQFWTWHAQFYVLRNGEATAETGPGDGLVRCDIADENGDWCGHIVLNEDWIDGTREGQKWHFIAISDARSFAREECRTWSHYIPKDREDIEWDLFFVLLIDWNPEKLVWERVGLGKVFQAAFDVSREWREIVLG